MNLLHTRAVLASAIFFATASFVGAQNFVLQSSVIGSGAVNGTSTNFKALGTVGQSAIGTGTSSNFKGSWGFWYTLGGGGGGALLADVNAFLEGPYVGGSMPAGISSDIPTSHPFAGSPWNYGGSESVPATDTSPSNGTPDFFDNNSDIVDWVFVQLRTGTPSPGPMTVIAERAGFIKSDGSIVDIDGSSALAFSGVPGGHYYVVVDHRNHLRAMSASALASVSSTITHDFTTALAQAYTGGGTAMKSLSGGKFGLFAADGNADDLVTAPDFNLWNSATTAGATGYEASDYNLDGIVTAPDFNLWNANTTSGATAQVPNP